MKTATSNSNMTGIHSEDFEAYQKSAGINASLLKQISPPRTPAHFKQFLDGPKPEPTPAQKMGVIVHRAILEPDTMGDAFHVKPEGMKFTTKEGKAWQEEHNDRPILSASEVADIAGMRDAVWSHPDAKAILKGAKTEQSLYAEDKNGVLRKCRLDALTGGNIIPDLKTCRDASEAGFSRDIGEWRYWYSAAYYLDLCNLLGITKEAFVCIAVEKEPPYLVALHQLDPEDVQAGRMAYRRDMALYRNCLKTGKWPGHPTGINMTSVSGYHRKEIEALLSTAG